MITIAVVRNLLIRAGADFSTAKKSMQQFQRNMTSFKAEVTSSLKGVQTVIAGIAASLATLGIAGAVKDAMQVEAAVGQLGRTMGENAKEFEQWARDGAAAFGLARTEAVRYGATYSQIISDFSKSTRETMKSTQDVLKAASIISASTGRDMVDVTDRIRSAFNQEADAADELGINVRVAALESSEAFKKLANGKQWSDLSQATQRQIILMQVLSETSRRYGDTLQNNTMRRHAEFTAQLRNIRTSFGEAFLPIYNAVLPALTRMATAIGKVMSYIAAFTQALFGFGQQTKNTDAQTVAVGGLGDAYEEAGKKAKGAVAGFDQLNLVGDKPGSKGAGGGGIAPTDTSEETGALTKVSEAMSGVSSKAREMADKVKAAYGELTTFIRENSDLIISALAGVGAAIAAAFLVAKWGSIVATVQRAGSAIAAAISAISLPIALIIAAVAALVGSFVYFYRTNEQFRDTVHTILQKIGEVATWLWQNVMTPFGEWLGTVMVAAWKAVGDISLWLWDNVLKPFGAWLLNVMPVAWRAVTAAAEWLWKNVLVPFGKFLKWLWDEVLVPIGKVLSDVLVMAFEAVADVAEAFWQHVLVPLGKALAEMFGPAVEAVSAVLTWLWKNVMEPFGTFIKTTIMPIIEGLIDVFVWLWDKSLKPLTNNIKDVVVSTFTNSFRTIESIIGGVKTTFIGLMNFITGTFTGDWGKAWNGVKDIFAGVFEALWGIVKFPLNQIIDGINRVIKGLNKISIDVPDWVPGVGGESFGISIPEIPKLDVGTNYVARDGLAFLHEGEAVVPKAYNPAAGGTAPDNRDVVSVLKLILQAVKASGNGDQASISKTDLARAAASGINDINRRTGKSAITV